MVVTRLVPSGFPQTASRRGLGLARSPLKEARVHRVVASGFPHTASLPGLGLFALVSQ